MRWRWTGGGIAVPAGDLGTWPIIAETGEELGQQTEEDWNM